MYWPGADGVNSKDVPAPPYVPSPLAAIADEVKAVVEQLSGPNALTTMLPVASPPRVVGLMEPLSPAGPPVPGLWAVPDKVTESLMGRPKSTGPSVASVVRVGCTGATVKHSRLALSLEPGTPAVSSPENS